jgi:hypothetical protein
MVNEQFAVKIASYERNGMLYVKVWHPEVDLTIGFNEKKPEYLNSILHSIGEIIDAASDENFIENKFYQEIDAQIEQWSKEV